MMANMQLLFAFACAAAVASAGAPSGDLGSGSDLANALASDDACAADPSGCALNALQSRSAAIRSHGTATRASAQDFASKSAQPGPGEEKGVNYFWPRYQYTNEDLKYDSKLALSSPYVCKWDVTLKGINMNQGILILPPCTYITPHWHPNTYELNFVMEGNMTYWIYNYGAPGEKDVPNHGFVPQGSALISPLGLMHLLYNGECDILSMMHSFPSSTNEDFFSAWANIQGMPENYLNNAMPESPGGNSMVGSLNIPDGIHTLSSQCMQRCGITQKYYESFKCPAELPFVPKVMKSFAPSPM